MIELEAARDRLQAAWPTLSEQDRTFVLTLLDAIATWVETKGFQP
jgi:hypothetical protein